MDGGSGRGGTDVELAATGLIRIGKGNDFMADEVFSGG